MNKRFFKSYIIPPFKLTLDYILLNYCLLYTTCFTYAEDNFNRVTILCDRRLTATNNTAQLNQYHEKNVSISTLKRRLCETHLYGRMVAKKPLLRKQNNLKKTPVGQGVQSPLD